MFDSSAKHDAHLQLRHPGYDVRPVYIQQHDMHRGMYVPEHPDIMNVRASPPFMLTGTHERRYAVQTIRGTDFRPLPPTASPRMMAHNLQGDGNGGAVYSNYIPQGSAQGSYLGLGKGDNVQLNHHFEGIPRTQYANGMISNQIPDGVISTRNLADAPGSAMSHALAPQSGRSYEVIDDPVNQSHLAQRTSAMSLPTRPGILGDPNIDESDPAAPRLRYPTSNMIRHTPLDDTAITCRTCLLRFQTATTYQQHDCRGFQVRKNPNDSRIKCDQCSVLLRNEQNLKRHVSVVHGARQAHPCPQCNGSFSSRGSLKIHQQTAHDFGEEIVHRNIPGGPQKKISKVFSCPLCPDTFKWKGNLKRHRALVHDKLKPFQCDICKAKFGTKSNMRVHLITHEKIRQDGRI